jgi:hypothetical protein
VRVIAGTEEIARHVRSYDTAQTIKQEAHVSGLVAATRQANPSSARDRLRLAVPAVATLFDRLAAGGESLRLHTARSLALLDEYGPQELGAAVARALERDAVGARRHRTHPGNTSPPARAEAADPIALAEKVQVVRDDDEAVLVRPRQDLGVRRGRSPDRGPVDSFEPVARQPLNPAWRQVHVHEQLHGCRNGTSTSSARHAA